MGWRIIDLQGMAEHYCSLVVGHKDGELLGMAHNGKTKGQKSGRGVPLNKPFLCPFFGIAIYTKFS